MVNPKELIEELDKHRKEKRKRLLLGVFKYACYSGVILMWMLSVTDNTNWTDYLTLALLIAIAHKIVLDDK